jgi:hypothetical protein
MNCETTFTRSQQRIAQLINIGRPLTDEESDELYRALHADYMRKWRKAKLTNERLRADLEMSAPAKEVLLCKLRCEARQPEWHEEHA